MILVYVQDKGHVNVKSFTVRRTINVLVLNGNWQDLWLASLCVVMQMKSKWRHRRAVR